MKFLAGANQPSGATLLLHESTSDRNLAVRSGGVRSGISDHVRRGAIQSLRVEQSASVSRRAGNCRESVLFIEQLLVHYRNPHAAGQRFKPQGSRPMILHSSIVSMKEISDIKENCVDFLLALYTDENYKNIIGI